VAAAYLDAGGAFETGIAVFLHAATMLAHFLGYFSMRSAADSLSDQSQDLIGSKRKDAEHQMAHHLGVASHSNRPPAELVLQLIILF
jgi:hypothetical protein